MDREAALANMRFTFLEKLCRETVVRPHESKEHKRSMAIDRLLTGKYTAIPCFLGIIALVFFLTFSVIGAALSDVMQMGIDFLTDLIDKGLTAFEINPVVHSLVIDGICAGVGSVLSFLPTIVTLFFFLSILEDTGYMARVAFVMDRPLRKLGLSGRSFVPMLMGFGCSVPAIMATRTLSSERDRKMTIMTTTFVPCGAKLPIIALIAGALFGGASWVAPSAYFVGIAAIICSGIILKKTKLFAGDPAPFVMELPAYHWPTVSNVLRSMWERGWSFIKKAGTIILLSTIFVWFTTYFGWVDGTFRMLDESEIDSSILAAIGGAISASSGADFLCYVTPAEHLCLPNAQDVLDGLMATKIAAHAADIAKKVPHARDMDDKMGQARRKLDWDAMWKCALDPVTGKKRYEESPAATEGTCTMCGKMCAVRTVNKIFEGTTIDLSLIHI